MKASPTPCSPLRVVAAASCTYQSLAFAAALVMLACSSPASALPYLPAIPKGDIAVRLQPIATGMAAPDYAINPPGDTSRLFVVEQNGLLRIIQNGVLQPGAALNIQNLVQVGPTGNGPLNPNNANDERGFLGLAFHPGFNNPSSLGYRTLYTYTSENIGAGATFATLPGVTANYKNLISEWKMSAADPNVVDPTSRREILSLAKNAGNHNGGTIAFGPDGYLYLATGDGGNSNDSGPNHFEPGGNAQNLSIAHGKMLRIDPLNPALTAGPNPESANGQYRIPADNPFTGAGQLREIHSYGFRNPYRFAFDTANGQLILADVGQNNIEEINRVTLGGNYGWAVKEGEWLFDRSNGSIGSPAPGNHSPGMPSELIDPISGPMGTLQYDHGDGISITGGFVYRGTAIPELVGKYVFGDLAIRNAPPRVDGRVFYADLTQGTIHEFRIPQFVDDLLPNSVTVHGFGQDGSGELYALVTNAPANGTGGVVYKFVAIPEPTSLALVGLSSLAAMCGVRRRRR
jgi:glucose/arabinose dehydrogenase